MGSNGAVSCLRRWGATASIAATAGTATGWTGRGVRTATECTWAWAAAFWSLTRQYTAVTTAPMRALAAWASMASISLSRAVSLA